jgi:hypothetical protein
MDWKGIASRLSLPGLALLVMGAAIGYEAPMLCKLVWKEKGEKLVTPMKLVGLALALVGALILLDFIPL